MEFKFFSRNGQLVPIAEAVVSLSNVEYQYGFGVYENIRVSSGRPLFLKDHLERLEESARIIGLEHRFDETFVERAVAELTKSAGEGTYNLKILLLGGKSAEDASLFILPLNPHFLDKKFYREGVSLITYEYERSFPHAKSLNMLESYLAYRKAKEAGAYDALLINRKRSIVEGTRTNFFAVQGTTLFEAPEEEILLGVTRKNVLEVAKAEGFRVETKNMRLSELEGHDGAFVTSTSSKIVPVKKVESFEFSSIPHTTKRLMEAFDSFLEKHAT